MKKFGFWLFLMGTWVSWFSACTDCDECGFSTLQPVFRATFFNIDSANILNDSSQALSMKIESLGDSILKYDSLFAATGDPQFALQADNFREDREIFDEQQNDVDSMEQLLRNGNVAVNDVVITAENNGDRILSIPTTNRNGLTDVILIPVNHAAGGSTYYISISGSSDTLEVSYQLIPESVGDIVRLFAIDFEVENTSYDSTFIQDIGPNENRLSEQRIVKCYF